MVIKKKKFYFDWILNRELAIGPSPNKLEDLILLKNSGFKSIFSLCSKEEASNPEQISEFFYCKRLILPDHKSGRTATLEEINEALLVLKDLIKNYNPVFIHCYAAMERSPLICLAWLIKEHKLSKSEALDYLMEVHKGTNPLGEQLATLNYLD